LYGERDPMHWQTARFGYGITSLRDVSLAEAPER
jgi:hypothetical protein